MFAFRLWVQLVLILTRRRQKRTPNKPSTKYFTLTRSVTPLLPHCLALRKFNLIRSSSSPLDEEAEGTFALHMGVQLVIVPVSHHLKWTPKKIELRKSITGPGSTLSLTVFVSLHFLLMPKGKDAASLVALCA